MNIKKKNIKRNLPLHLMILPGFILVLIYSYGPMVGIIMAFEKFTPSKGILRSPFIGLENFRFVMNLPTTFQVIWNTLFISTMKIAGGIVVPVLYALLLNEVNNNFIKRTVQTVIYFPHFLSWVILSGIFIDILSPSTGIVNDLLKAIGIKPIFWLGDPNWFPCTLAITDIWKEFGFGTIIYLTALTNIDPTLYEASYIDGAGRFKQTLYITLPSIMHIIMLMTILSLGNILNAGFEQVFNLYSPQVYSTGDIIDTLVYRLGMENTQYGVATAVGLFKSVVSFLLIGLSYYLANKYTDYHIF